MFYKSIRVILPLLLAASLSPMGQAVIEKKAVVRTSQVEGKPKRQTDTHAESPFACNSKALDTTERRRWMELLVKLNETKQEVRELPDGYAFRFPAETATIQSVAEFIGYERRCCPFFDLELALEREGGPLWLRFKGREGVKAFIRSEFKLP